jgi:hypothetical protein
MVSFTINELVEWISPNGGHRFTGTCQPNEFHLGWHAPENAKRNRESMELSWSCEIKLTEINLATINYEKNLGECFLHIFLLKSDFENFCSLADKKMANDAMTLRSYLSSFAFDDRRDVRIEDFYEGLTLACYDFQLSLSSLYEHHDSRMR